MRHVPTRPNSGLKRDPTVITQPIARDLLPRAPHAAGVESSLEREVVQREPREAEDGRDIRMLVPRERAHAAVAERREGAKPVERGRRPPVEGERVLRVEREFKRRAEDADLRSGNGIYESVCLGVNVRLGVARGGWDAHTSTVAETLTEVGSSRAQASVTVMASSKNGPARQTSARPPRGAGAGSSSTHTGSESHSRSRSASGGGGGGGCGVGGS